MPQDHRARRRAETHRRIHDEAMRLFQERGYDEVTTAHIAAAAKVSVPTFYDHYPSKDHLIMALPEPAEVEALLAQQPADLPLGVRMRGALMTFIGVLTADQADALARWRIIVATPGLRYRAAEFERATAQMLLDALGAGDDTAAQVVVTAHLSAYTQILLRWAGSGGEEPLEEIAEEVLAALRTL